MNLVCVIFGESNNAVDDRNGSSFKKTLQIGMFQSFSNSLHSFHSFLLKVHTSQFKVLVGWGLLPGGRGNSHIKANGDVPL